VRGKNCAESTVFHNGIERSASCSAKSIGDGYSCDAMEQPRPIQRALDYRGVTQTDLALALGVTPAAVNRWISGINQPNANAIASMSRILRLSADVLIGLKPLGPAESSVDLKQVSERLDALVTRAAELSAQSQSVEEEARSLLKLLGSPESSKSTDFDPVRHTTPKKAEALASELAPRTGPAAGRRRSQS
jgi:transcriptional regulator with XRE-family HTH domain